MLSAAVLLPAQQQGGKDSADFAGKAWPPIPNNVSMFLVPTGFPMETGEIYYQNFSLFFNQFHFGASEEFSVGFAFESLSLLLSLDSIETYSPGFVLSPKVSIPVIEDRLSVGLGTLFAELPDTEVFLDLGFVLATATYGSRDKNISLGVGFGLIEGEFSVQPTVFFSAHYRFNRRLVLITENGLIPGPNFGFSNTAIRIMGRRLHWDLGLMGLGAKGEPTQTLPIIGLVIPVRNP